MCAQDFTFINPFTLQNMSNQTEKERADSIVELYMAGAGVTREQAIKCAIIGVDAIVSDRRDCESMLDAYDVDEFIEQSDRWEGILNEIEALL